MRLVVTDLRPLHPPDQRVRARFTAVQDPVIDMQAGYLGNTILAQSVTPYERREAQRFTFSGASFEELPE